MYQIIFSRKSLKFLKKIPVPYQVLIKKTSEKLAVNPFKLDLKKLASPYKATHRLRIGNYRLFLRIKIEEKLIEIAEIERRTTQTYH